VPTVASGIEDGLTVALPVAVGQVTIKLSFALAVAPVESVTISMNV
jgi:hypothetical protein